MIWSSVVLRLYFIGEALPLVEEVALLFLITGSSLLLALIDGSVSSSIEMGVVTGAEMENGTWRCVVTGVVVMTGAELVMTGADVVIGPWVETGTCGISHGSWKLDWVWQEVL